MFIRCGCGSFLLRLGGLTAMLSGVTAMFRGNGSERQAEQQYTNEFHD
jgi:hypothetical protein